MRAEARNRPGLWLALLAAAVAIAAFAFMTLGLRGRLDIVLPLRGMRLAALLAAALAIAVSTVLFQTVTANRILTPAIVGLDWLYVLIQTVAVFVLGGGAFALIGARPMFAIETLAMTGFVVALFWGLMGRERGDLQTLLLVGVVAGALFRSLSSLIQRMIDPSAFAVLQDRSFASFNSVNRDLLGLGAALIIGATILAWRMRRELDVLALGRDSATSLGLDWRLSVNKALILVAVLVSVSTALVGPVTFFGLLVVNLALQLPHSHRHAVLLPGAALVAALILVLGQMTLERVFAFSTALSIVIEFAGGLVFLFLLLRGSVR